MAGGQRSVWCKGFMAVEKVFIVLGVICGIAMTIVLVPSAIFVPSLCRGLVATLAAINLLLLLQLAVRTPPAWLARLFRVGRVINWVVGIVFAIHGLQWVLNSRSSYDAMIYMAAALMFVLWAGAARRITPRHVMEVRAS